ncbi:MAG: KpsF/GutQ family sugar-phosphate isomerase [Gemmatimonas sp.]
MSNTALLPDGPGTDDVIVARGRRVLELERDALSDMHSALDANFVRAVRIIAGSTGRVIVSGVGKSGLVARKIAATMTSTGTPAVFLHPVESLHGDLGVVGSNDVAILISKSGNTDELAGLIDALARLGVHLIAMTTDMTSHLARHAEVALQIAGREEACPHDLAPTTSTTATMALGDALAVALLQEKSFRADDFARLHPGGALGRRLLTRVGDVMDMNALVVLSPDATMKDAVVLLAKQRGLAIVAEHEKVLGVVTGGDLARFLERDANLDTPVHRVMSASPRTAREDELGSAVVHRMEQSGIMAMPVLNDHGKLAGVVHLHDLLRAGVA